MKVLVVDNHQQTLDHLSDLLEKDGFETVKASSGQEGLDSYAKESPDFICLDIMMDDMTGYDVCKEIRKEDEEIPIIFISSKSETFDKVLGLELGADDYIVKPFDIYEVTARIRTIAKRCLAKKPVQGGDDEVFDIGSVTVYPQKLRADKGDEVIELSLRDIKILRLLYDKRNQIIDRNTLLDYCWGAHIMPESRTVDWHISQLRKKIEDDPKKPAVIQTVHGVGYKYMTDEA